MRNVCPPDDLDLDWDLEYYFLHPNKVFRIAYDDQFDECTISEVMGIEGMWFDCDADQALADGIPISEADARAMVDGFDGDW